MYKGQKMRLLATMVKPVFCNDSGLQPANCRPRPARRTCRRAAATHQKNYIIPPSLAGSANEIEMKVHEFLMESK